MNYATKTRTELQALRNRFLTATQNPRLNTTNRANIETWVAEIESELLKAAPVAAAKPVTVTAVPAMMTEREKWNCWS